MGHLEQDRLGHDPGEGRAGIGIAQNTASNGLICGTDTTL